MTKFEALSEFLRPTLVYSPFAAVTFHQYNPYSEET